MSVWSRIRQSLRPGSKLSGIDAEIASHIQLRADAYERDGLSASRARTEAARKFGSRARFAEEVRDVHHFAWLDTLRRESGYSIRGLLHRPAFLTAGLLTLAIGIGVNVAVFSLLDGVFLKPLPLPEADRVFLLKEFRNGQPISSNPARLRDYTDAATSFSAIGGFYSETIVVDTPGGAQPLNAFRFAGDAPAAFGYRPAIGRFPAPGERDVAIISDRYWERQFGRLPSAIGATLKTRTGPLEIIGVFGPNEALLSQHDFWSPVGQANLNAPRTAGFLTLIARLKPTAGRDRANAELATISANDKGLSATLEPLDRAFATEAQKFAVLLSALVFTVLLIACANLAGLLLSRQSERSREASIRSAIGATRWDLLRVFLLESVWLTIPGGLLGLLTGIWTLDVLKSLLPEDLPRLATVAIDIRAAAFALALTLVCAVAIGILPAWQIARQVTRTGHRQPRTPLRAVLVVGQIAVAVVLLLTASLQIHALLEARMRPLGFQPSRVFVIQYNLPWDAEPAKVAQFYKEIEDTVASVPGVRASGLVDRLPFGGGSQDRRFLRIRDKEIDESLARQSYGFRAATPGYFTAMGIAVLQGVLPDPRLPEIAVNETFAKRYFGAESPIGRQISFSNPNQPPAWFTVTGMVANVPQNALETRTFGDIFVPFSRTFWPVGNLVVSAEGDFSPILAAARRVDPFAHVRYAGPLQDRLDAAYKTPNTVGSLLGGLALAALGLVCIGIYGMLAGFVRGRTRDFGVRLALGATPGSITQLSIYQGIRLAFFGLILGSLLAWPALRTLPRFLPGAVSPHPGAIAAAGLLLIGAVLLACYGPARRAGRLDPAIVLRHD